MINEGHSVQNENQAVMGLQWRAGQLRAEAARLNAEAAELERQAVLLGQFREDLKDEAVQRMVETGLEAEADWLQSVYEQRVAMRARGEEIDLPDDVSGMKAMLARESAATAARKAQG